MTRTTYAKKIQRIRRKVEKENSKPKYSLNDVQKAMNIAITIKKYSKGHLFKKGLKDMCMFCGDTMKTKRKCNFWFLTFLDRMQVVLVNPQAFTDKEIEALWFTHGDEYKDISLPLNFSDGKDD